MSRSAVTAMRFIVDDKHLIKWMPVKLCSKTLAKDSSWEKMKSWWGEDASQKYQCETFNCVDLCNGVAHNPSTCQWRHCCRFNQLKLYPLSGNIL